MAEEIKGKEGSVFNEKFTGLYSLSKTLRFELKPVGRTLENMRWHLRYDEKLQTFFADQEIEDAYQTLKPVFDAIHEKFITESLISDNVQKINFNDYLEKYKNKKELNDKDFEHIEKPLRQAFGELYNVTAENWKKKDDCFSENGFNILTEKGILEYIKNHADEFREINTADKINEALAFFHGFFTYFGGFNQNRENYYETEKEAKTAVATRIIGENLPKFCDNILSYEERMSEYTGAYSTLKKLGRILEMKDGTPLVSITEDTFQLSRFNHCFSQEQIDAYNQKIRNANFLINLYNQAKREEVNFKRLPFFKTLYKQIGCGKKKMLFFTLSCDTKKEAEEARKKNKEVFSVEEILCKAAEAGEKYLTGKNDDSIINTVPEFIDFVMSRNDYLGVYWSKQAINTISGKYLANWYDMQEKLKRAKIFKKGDAEGEIVKIPDAVELDGLFSILDDEKDWQNDGAFFKRGLTEDVEDPKKKIKNEKRKKIIIQAATPSEALLRLIFDDMTEYAEAFTFGSKVILSISEYKSSESKAAIKSWVDNALSAYQMLKYFSVREKKTKGAPLDSGIAEALKILLHSDDAKWFDWYDALRNYLTKKPQDDAKKNKLKLNFENGSLLEGWSDGQEKIKGAVLLKNEGGYYLGILKKRNIFDTEKEDNEIYTKESNSGRLILSNIKFQTLAGKGFVSEFKQKYSEMGLENPMKAILSLQKIIKDRYQNKYPPLKVIAETKYEDIKTFNKEIQETLKDCYTCNFRPVDWGKILKAIDDGDLYVFQLYSKDFATKSFGKKNLQSNYWEALFTENSPFQLTAGAKLFYRKQAILEKDLKVKKGYEEKKYVIENKRFTTEKFIFHCSINLNYTSPNGVRNGKPNPVAIKATKERINELITNGLVSNFLGIDRGEKHLAYYFLTDKHGNGIAQGTLNIPFLDKEGNTRIVKSEKRYIKDGKEQIETVDCKDYNDLLDARAGDRNYARKNWQSIGKIADLKDGYVSQAVRKIVDLAIENNAMIVLEDLNAGFMRGRQKIEKSVYQKLELALAKKLNFLVDKNAKMGEIGSATKALQLAPPVVNFGDIEKRKQVGIMLYTRANYTSQTDPVTGWRKTIYLKTGSEEYIKKQIIDNFSDIYLDRKDYCFVYKDKNTGKEWKLYSGENGVNLDRFHREKGGKENTWISTKQDIEKMLGEVFVKFDKKKSLLEQIKNESAELAKIDSKRTAWESLRFIIDLIQQIRNTGTATEDNDFILSPVRGENGNHFDSRKASENLPTSGDANGAFNIARKGIIMSEHIKRGYSLYISDEEWDAWLAGKEVWETYLSNNMDKLLPKKKKIQ